MRIKTSLRKHHKPWLIHHRITCSLLRPIWLRTFLGGELKDLFRLVCRRNSAGTSSRALHPPPAPSFTKQQLLRVSHVYRHCIMPKLQARHRRNAFSGTTFQLSFSVGFQYPHGVNYSPLAQKTPTFWRRFRWKGFFLICEFDQMLHLNMRMKQNQLKMAIKQKRTYSKGPGRLYRTWIQGLVLMLELTWQVNQIELLIICQKRHIRKKN